MSISSKCDIPSLPSWTPTLATKSLLKGRLFRVHVATTVWWLSPLLLITAWNESQEGWGWGKEGGEALVAIFSQWHRPHRRLFPSMPTFHHPSDVQTSTPDETSVFQRELSNWSCSAARRAGVKGPPPVLVCVMHANIHVQTQHFELRGRILGNASRCPVSYDKCYHAPFSCYFTTRCLTVSPRFPRAHAAWPKSSIWTAVKGLYVKTVVCVEVINILWDLGDLC